MPLDLDTIAHLPKVVLHDHLDGGLRPQTVGELAEAAGHELPTTDADALGRWFFEAADSGSLVRYLETFSHTVACMQTSDALTRVAREFVLDLAADGAIYAEARWAPAQHLAGGLTLRQAVDAVRDGLNEGMAECARQGRPIIATQLITAMRHTDADPAIPELADAYRQQGASGFDIAGAEAGFPARNHASSFAWLRGRHIPYTIHAGEAAGLDSIADAVAQGASRIGHGVRLVEDMDRTEGGYRLGQVARYILDRRITLEVCPTSNVQTGICERVAEHPVGDLMDAGFSVSINCDNRLMSATSMTRELALVTEGFALDAAALERLTTDAMRAAFYPYEERRRLIRDVIRPAFARVG